MWRLGRAGGHGGPGDQGGRSRAGSAACASQPRLELVLVAEGSIAAMAVALSPAGDAVFAGMADGTLWGWDLPSGTRRFGGAQHEPHPTLAALPRRRRPHRNPFASVFGGPNSLPVPKPIRRLIALPSSSISPASSAASSASPASPCRATPLLVGSIGHHGVFPVWDGETGDAPGGTGPSSFADNEPAYHEDGLCHVAVSADGARMYTTSIDAKGLRAWDTSGDGGGGVGGGVKGGCVWRSERLTVRNVYLAGLAILPRPAHGGGRCQGDAGTWQKSAATGRQGRQSRSPPPLLATCAASMVPGTCYAEVRAGSLAPCAGGQGRAGRTI